MLRTSALVFVLCSALGGTGLGEARAQPGATRIIFDTDIESDVDDVGAVALLHALADEGEADLLGMMVSSSNPWSAPSLDALNTYYGRPDLPIGVVKSAAPNRKSDYAQDLAEAFPHDLTSSRAAPEATALYRELLARQPDSSVVIVSVGYLTNLANLLRSKPDTLSPLSGRELIRKKVKRYVSMGGRFPREEDPGVYGNFKPAPQAARAVVEDWPTEIVFVGGGDFAHKYRTGGRLADDLPPSNPVRRAYEWFFDRASWAQGPTHHSADLIAVWVAVRGLDPDFDVVTEGANHVFENGTNAWRRAPNNEAQSYVVAQTEPATVARRMDALLGQGPRAADTRKAPSDSVETANEAPAAAPNILVFVADDAGWQDAGAYGNAAIRTPTIDHLAETGLRVENAFLTIAQCSPSRISILTGKYPHATGAEDLHMPLPDSLRIVPSYLSGQGYYTGHMGKTHYGPHADAQFDWYAPAEDHDFSAFADFLEQAQEQPFFMWTGFRDPHRPYDTTAAPAHDPADVALTPYLADTPATRADRARYYDEIHRMDANMGRMLKRLEARGLRENTLVIYLSDNGAPFPQEKGTVYDAGIRTPLIFSWPAQIEAGQVYDRGLVSVIDLAPTLLELAGVEEAPAQMQGRSLAALLENPSAYEGREYVFAERNWHDCDEHIRAVRTARYKLVRVGAYTALPMCTAADLAGSPSWFALNRRWSEGELTPAQRRMFAAPRPQIELYDLEADPWETNNVADEAAYRATARRLAQVLSEWMAETGDFPPALRWRPDATDRLTGLYFYDGIPPMRDAERP